MTLKTTLALLTSGLLIAAAVPTDRETGKLRTIEMDKWHDELTCRYDLQGRISNLSASHGYEMTYEYQGNAVIAKSSSGQRITMFMNAYGLVDSLVDVDSSRVATVNPDGSEQINLGREMYFPYSGNYIMPIEDVAGAARYAGFITFSRKFTYDDHGFITEEKVYLQGKGDRHITSTRTVQNGNVISYSVKYPIDTLQMLDPKTLKVETKIVRQGDFTVKNTYDPTKANSLTTDFLFGKSSKNLLLRSVKYDQLAQDSDVTTFSYTFNKAGKVSSLITVVKTNDPPDVKPYTERPDTCLFSYY